MSENNAQFFCQHTCPGRKALEPQEMHPDLEAVFEDRLWVGGPVFNMPGMFLMGYHPARQLVARSKLSPTGPLGSDLGGGSGRGHRQACYGHSHSLVLSRAAPLGLPSSQGCSAWLTPGPFQCLCLPQVRAKHIEISRCSPGKGLRGYKAIIPSPPVAQWPLHLVCN